MRKSPASPRRRLSLALGVKVKIERISVISEDVLDLAEKASDEGHQNIKTLIREFLSGENRFLKTGEALFGAYENQQLVGIGGLNIDPYEETEHVGRVRRLYVVPTERRRGVASRLMNSIEEHAAQHFGRIQLFTPTEDAARFYSRLGYQSVSDKRKVSHEKRFDT